MSHYICAIHGQTPNYGCKVCAEEAARQARYEQHLAVLGHRDELAAKYNALRDAVVSKAEEWRRCADEAIADNDTRSFKDADLVAIILEDLLTEEPKE